MQENRVNHNSNKAQEDSEMGQDQGRVLCRIYNNVEQQQYDKKYMIWIKRVESKQARVVCYWNMSEVKQEKLKCTMKERTRKTSQTMQLNKYVKWRKLNRKKRN